MRTELEQSAAGLSAGDRNMVLIGSVPELSFHAPEAILNHATFGMKLPEGPSRSDFERRNGHAQSILQDARDAFGAVLLSPADFLCASQCRLLQDDQILYRDDDHLSIYGARWLVAPMMGDRLPGK